MKNLKIATYWLTKSAHILSAADSSAPDLENLANEYDDVCGELVAVRGMQGFKGHMVLRDPRDGVLVIHHMDPQQLAEAKSSTTPVFEPREFKQTDVLLFNRPQ